MGAGIVTILRSFVKRRSNERSMEAELRFHLERETEENIRRGMRPDEAAQAARRTLGRMEQVKEECRDARAGRLLETTLQDMRYGLRVLRKNPGFTVAAAATLALGIGVNTAIFSLVYGALLRPLPYGNGERLVVLHQQANKARLADVPFSYKEITDYRDQSRTLDGVVEYHSMVFLLLGKDTAERVQTGIVSANFFDVLGVKPLYGRTFVAADEAHGAEAVLVLSNKYWQTRHGGNPNIVGQVFQMNNRPHTVIGVLPPIPQYPAENDVYMPTSQCPTRSSQAFMQNRNSRMMTAFGRLKPGVTVEQAKADLATVAKQIEHANPESYPAAYGYTLAAAPLRDDLTNKARFTFFVLLGAAGFVLLIACANVANLLLARLLRLERELAVRSALGASRLRLARQLLTESILLSVIGGAIGLALAPATLSLLTKFAERFTTRAAEVRIDTPVLVFAAALALVTGVLFGMAPALSSTRGIAAGLKDAAGRATASRGRQMLRSGLVVAQVAVSFVLLVGAGLMVRSLIELHKVNPGFQPDRLLVMRVTANFTKYGSTAKLQPVYSTMVREVSTMPGVVSAALVSNPPFSPSGIAAGPSNTSFEIEGQPTSKGELAPMVDITVASPEYFATVRQPLLAGREFTDHDERDGMLVGIINQTMARHRFANTDPVGKRITFDNRAHWTTIVGVVGDVKEYGLQRPVGDEVYMPLKQAGFAGNLVVRTAGDPNSMAPLIRTKLRDIDSQLAIDRVSTIERFVEDSVAPPRVTATLLSLFAVLALIISAGGIAAVMALSVSQRTHELGIRLALGATRRSVIGMVVRNGVALGVAGIVIGAAGALALTRVLASLLFAVSPRDAATFAGVSVVFLAVAVVACFLPARQITSIDPVIALRHE